MRIFIALAALMVISHNLLGKEPTKEELFKSFEASMKNVRFSGHFTVTGKDLVPAKETYEIQSWFDAGSTYASGRTDIERWKKIPRYEFVGNISMEMRKKYLHKSVDHYWKAKAQNPMRYILKNPN